jgi:hypothetical protein
VRHDQQWPLIAGSKPANQEVAILVLRQPFYPAAALDHLDLKEIDEPVNGCLFVRRRFELNYLFKQIECRLMTLGYTATNQFAGQPSPSEIGKRKKA